MLKNTVLVHYSKQDVLQDEVYPILQKKLNLKKFGIGEIEKLLNRTNQFVGIKKRCVQKGQIYRMMVEKFDGQEGIGKAYYEDSIVEVGGVPQSGVFNIVIYRTDHFYAKGAITDSKPTSSDVAEEVKYYLYNHHLVIELLYIERCSVFSLRRMMCIEKTPPLLKAELHLQESCTISKVSKWEFVKFTKDDRFRLTCTLCSGTGNVECNKCNGEVTLPCNTCSSSGKLKCFKCKETGYTFYCHVCDGRGSIYEPSQTCNRCSGTGQYTWSNACNRCGGIGKYRGTLKDCFGCNGTGRYSGSKECNSCEGSGFHRVGGDRECHYCHGRAKQVCEKCNGTALFICIKCSGLGRIDCFGCDATGKMTCPKCNATGTVACHLKSIKHASECEGECSDDDVVQLESGESKTILNRKATIVVDAWRTASSKRFCDEAREYNDLIYEKIINNEFAVLHEYVTRDKIAKEAEFEETKQKAEYHKVEASIDHASEGCMFAFYTHTNCKDTFRKAQVVEIEGESGKKTGVVSEVHSDHLNVRFKNREELSSSGVIQHKFVKSPFRCQRECISTLQNKNADVLAIKDVLCRLSTLEVPSKVNVKSYFNPNIAKTSGQKKAVDLAYSEPPILLLQGPPGTGKTTVIYEMIRQCISNPRSRVLMASQGNAAVDNVLAKLHKDQDLDEDILAVRLGGKDSFTIDEAKEYTFPVQFRQFQKDIRERTEDAYDKLQNSLTGLRETDTKVTGLIQLEEELEDKNRELATITSQFSEYINKKERLVQTISETNRLRIDLKNKIEASKKSIFKKMINGLLSVFNRDPASRMVKTDIRLSGLQKEQSSVNNIIKEIETNQRAVKAKLSTLSNRKETYPETVLRISEKGLGALREHQKAQSKILKRREDVFSLMKEWKDFVDTGQEALEQ